MMTRWIDQPEWSESHGADLAVLFARTYRTEAEMEALLGAVGIGAERIPNAGTPLLQWRALLKDLLGTGRLEDLLNKAIELKSGLRMPIQDLINNPPTYDLPSPQIQVRRGDRVLNKFPDQPSVFIFRRTVHRLAAALESGENAVCVITGLRGVGKTHIAAAYVRAKRNSDYYDAIGWVDAETMGTLIGGLAQIADRLGVNDPERDSKKSAIRLRDHLTGWDAKSLLVFDNAEDPDAIRQFLPTNPRAHVIVTSADLALGNLGRQVDASFFTRQESIDFLHRTTGHFEDEAAGAIADELGNLPLALSQAAATIRDQRLSYQEYLDLLGEPELSVSQVLDRVPGHDYPQSTATALLLSVDSIDKDPDQAASRLLRIVAVLSPAGVNKQLLVTANTPQPTVADKLAVNRGLARCVRAAVLSWSDDSVTMHRLVARLVRENEKAKGTYSSTVVAALDAMTPNRFIDWQVTPSNREFARHLIAQFDALWKAARGHVEDLDILMRIIDERRWGVLHLNSMADINLQLQAAEQLHDDCVDLLGPQDWRTIRSVCDLAGAKRAKGNLLDAIPIYRQALESGEKALGSDHEQTMACRNALGHALKLDHQLGEAIPLLERARDDRERILGREHPLTLTSRGNVAMAYLQDHRNDEALELCSAVLEDRKRILGVDHPVTLDSRNDLAYCYIALKDLDKAVELLEENLDDRIRTRGALDPLTLVSQANLAEAYETANDFEKAARHFQENLDLRLAIYDADSVNVQVAQRRVDRIREKLAAVE